VGPGPNQVSREDGKRRIVVSAMCAGAISAPSWHRLQELEGVARRQLLDTLGRNLREESARQRLMIVVPVALALVSHAVCHVRQCARRSHRHRHSVCVDGGIAALWLRGIPLHFGGHRL
jgi:cobalt-zinc-cadmium resistance protein CzcA